MPGAKKVAEKVLRKLGVQVVPRWARSPTYGAPGLKTGRAIPPAWAGARTGQPGRPAGDKLLPCDVRAELHIPGNRTRVYSSDRSGTVEYSFNSAGYRSEELDPQASFRLCVLGESHGVGTGVEFDRTVGQRFKTHLSDALDLPETAVNVVNLSVDGASADYCIRTLIRQIDIVLPDLVFLNMPAVDRMEDYGPKTAQNYHISGVDLDRFEEMPEPIQGFFDLYNPHLGYMNQVRNALMFQMACHLRGVEHIIAAPILKPRRFATPILEPMFKQLDRDRIMLNMFFQVRVDLAADDAHAGPLSHEAMAIDLLDRYARLVEQTRGEADAAKLRRHVDRLKAESDDWAFVLDAIARAGGEAERAKAKA